jgi:probable rRNA maturation factor
MNALDLIVEDEGWTALSGKTRLAEKAVQAACQDLSARRPGVVAILLTGDEAVAELNTRFRDKTGPTNVLSFPAPDDLENHLGDMALAWGVVEREAQARKISVGDHLSHLLIHGFLHLQGYDHQTDEEAVEMEGIETQALARIGIANPYADEKVVNLDE